MYIRLARSVAAYPLRYAITWLLIVLFTATAALTGFGDPLFNRLNTDIPQATPSESWAGDELIREQSDSNYPIIAFIEGVDLKTELTSAANRVDKAKKLGEQAKDLGEQAKDLGARAQEAGDKALALKEQAEKLGAQAQGVGAKAQQLAAEAKAAGARAQNAGAQAQTQGAKAQDLARQAQEKKAQAEAAGAKAGAAAAAGDLAGAAAGQNEAQTIGAQAAALGEQAQSAGQEALKFKQRAQADASRAQALAAQARETGEQATSLGTRATGLGEQARVAGQEAKDLGEQAKALGDRAEKTGQEAKDETEPDWPVAKALHQELKAPLAALEKRERVKTVASPFVEYNAILDEKARKLVGRSADAFAVVVTMDVTGLEKPKIVSVEKALRNLHDPIVKALQIGGADASKVKVDIFNQRITTDQGIKVLQKDLIHSESIGIPLSFLIMVLVFGGALAALMPLSGALVAISTALAIILGLTYITPQQSFSLNVISVLGLGLSIDYGLLIVSRYRESLATLKTQDLAQYRPDLSGIKNTKKRARLEAIDPRYLTAIMTTLATAGRTVFFSALTVAVSISGMMFFKPALLKSLGIAGISVVIFAAACALTLVPALIVLAKERMDKPSLITRIPGLKHLHAYFGEKFAHLETQVGVQESTGQKTSLKSRWQTQRVRARQEGISFLGLVVTKHPWVFLVTAVVILLMAALPASNLQLRNSLLELFPTDYPSRVLVNKMTQETPALSFPQVQVVAENTTPADLDKWMEEKAASVKGVREIFDATKLGQDNAVANIRLETSDSGSREAEDVVKRLRALDHDFTRYISGQPANQLDFVQSLIDGLPWALIMVVLASVLLLFLMTGSVVIPLQALAFNTLSIVATLGLATLVFVEGVGLNIINSPSVGGLESYVVVMLVCFGFGLSTDYEMFLLSRVKEVWDATGDNRKAVAVGMHRAGRIITSAASILLLVFYVFMIGDMVVLKEVGFMMGTMVLLDAIVVRQFLAPSVMSILGRANWWAPAPLRRIHQSLSAKIGAH